MVIIYKLDDKPGYVESDHLSRLYVTIKLKRPTWDLTGSHSSHSRSCFFGLASSGVYRACSVTRSSGELLPRLSTLTMYMAVYFCCTSLGVSSTGRYPAPCPAKPGLSSPVIWQPRSLVQLITFIAEWTQKVKGKIKKQKHGFKNYFSWYKKLLKWWQMGVIISL